MKTILYDNLSKYCLKPKRMGLTSLYNKNYFNNYKSNIFNKKLLKSEGDSEYIKEFKKCIDEFNTIKDKNNFRFVHTDILDEDIYIGSTFNYVINERTKEEEKAEIIVKAIIHEWYMLPYKCIRKYHNGIVLLEFKKGLPRLMFEMKDNLHEVVLVNKGEEHEV